MPSLVKHIFVLSLENRAFDHMFGFSRLSGQNAEKPGETTQLDGLTGNESNTFGGKSFPVTRDAPFVMPADPGHEFPNVLDQLCGAGVRYHAPYPPLEGGGFVDSYVRTGGAHASPEDVMKCFETARDLPVLFKLAQEFAICDRWFAALPGPTWPNRMFLHAASSGGLEHSPTTAEIVEWEMLDGFSFPNGHIFQALKAKNIPYHFYSGDEFPMVAALRGIDLGDVHRVDDLVEELKKPLFPYGYVFIEPSYDVLNDYRHGDSQHPLGDVRAGEALVKRVYEALRASEIWESSVLIIVWDEHGGFYDHVLPPPAVPPGDTALGSKYNQSGFTFAQHGVRVPALVVSPLVPRGTIDHRTYDHASIPATVEALFGLTPLTARDASAQNILPLLSLAEARKDTPQTLPGPVTAFALTASAAAVSRPDASVNADNLPSILHGAVRQDLLLAPARKAEILARVASLKTRHDTSVYLEEVRGRLKGAGWSAATAPAAAPRLRDLAQTLQTALRENRPFGAVQRAVDDLSGAEAGLPAGQPETLRVIADIEEARRRVASRLDRERARYGAGIATSAVTGAILVIASASSNDALALPGATLSASLVGALILMHAALCIRRLFEVSTARSRSSAGLDAALVRLGASGPSQPEGRAS